jgi:phage regulator Rha-like protein
MQKINETKFWFFEENKQDCQMLANLNKGGKRTKLYQK